MALTTRSAWALMDGGTPPQEVRMWVTAKRGFWLQGKLVKPGETVEIPEMLVRELLSSAKVELATTPPNEKDNLTVDSTSA